MKILIQISMKRSFFFLLLPILVFSCLNNNDKKSEYLDKSDVVIDEIFLNFKLNSSKDDVLRHIMQLIKEGKIVDYETIFSGSKHDTLKIVENNFDYYDYKLYYFDKTDSVYVYSNFIPIDSSYVFYSRLVLNEDGNLQNGFTKCEIQFYKDTLYTLLLTPLSFTFNDNIFVSLNQMFTKTYESVFKPDTFLFSTYKAKVTSGVEKYVYHDDFKNLIYNHSMSFKNLSIIISLVECAHNERYINRQDLSYRDKSELDPCVYCYPNYPYSYCESYFEGLPKHLNVEDEIYVLYRNENIHKLLSNKNMQKINNIANTRNFQIRNQEIQDSLNIIENKNYYSNQKL